MRHILMLTMVTALFSASAVFAQDDRSDRTRSIMNATPALADSTWPIYHANRNATASTSGTGPGVVTHAQSVESLKPPRARKPYVSPWTVMAEPYADGSQAVITTPNNGLAKYLIRNDKLEAIDFLKIDRKFFDFDWGVLLLDNGLGVTTQKKKDRLILFGDRETGRPDSPLAIKATIPVDREKYGKLSAHLTLAPDGTLITLTDANKLIAVDLVRRDVIQTYDLPSRAGMSFHNSFPMDETGRAYLSTQSLMVAVDWRDGRFSEAWTAEYDMRGPGCESVPADRKPRKEAIAVAKGETCTGSGTTPTLLGDRDTGIVAIVDGHSPRNNLIAFWRHAPPPGWTALADPTGRKDRLDPRVAGVFALPYSTPDGPGYTAENSPAALGNGIVVAQWAGFRPRGRSLKGLQRVNWNPETAKFELAWANPDIHFNGVPTIACREEGRDCHAYGMGLYDGRYDYASVDFETGRESGRIDLGTEDDILDQGNNHAVAADGSIVFSGKTKMTRIK